MTAFTSPTTLDASKVIAPGVVPEALLTTRACFASPPWQYVVFSELHQLEKAISSTGGGASEPQVAQGAIMFARTVLADLHQLNIPSPIVCPIDGGGLGMVWSLGSKQLEVALAADQSGSFILSKDEQVVGDGDIAADSTSDLERALRAIVSV